jgi:hypothetical protein
MGAVNVNSFNKIYEKSAKIKMWNFVQEALQAFSAIFKRSDVFKLFIVMVVALMCGVDVLGVSSAIRTSGQC